MVVRYRLASPIVSFSIATSSGISDVHEAFQKENKIIPQGYDILPYLIIPRKLLNRKTNIFVFLTLFS
jgi:hypothetical protein